MSGTGMRIGILDEAMPPSASAEGARVQRGQHAHRPAEHPLHVRRLLRRGHQGSRPGEAPWFPAHDTHAIPAAGSDRPAGAVR